MSLLPTIVMNSNLFSNVPLVARFGKQDELLWELAEDPNRIDETNEVR